MSQYSSYSDEDVEIRTTLSDKQKKAIKSLKKAAIQCKECGLWLFMNMIMVYGIDGECVLDSSVSIDFHVGLIDMHVDGGDF
jgi:hypothetical protein